MAGIFVLGWGSLVWRPGELNVIGDWSLDGPTLPIEFSRISDNKRLTLVIDETNGVPVVTRSIQSACTTLDDAIDNLRIREGAPSAKGIGFADIRSGNISTTALERHAATAHEIARWAKAKGADGVIWTAIGPRWPLQGSFSAEAAAQYLTKLQDPERLAAHEYVRKAPPEVVTPVRKRFDELMGQ